MAKACEKYWADVFKERPSNEAKTLQWALEDLSRLPAMSWDVDYEHILSAINFSTDSAPGPDGIPYSAYKFVGGAAGILHRALQFLVNNPHLSPPHDFNHAILCLLGKKSLENVRVGWAHFIGQVTLDLSLSSTLTTG